LLSSELPNGNVKLIVFVQAPLADSVRHVQIVDDIRENLIGANYNNVSFLGINSKKWHSRLRVSHLRDRAHFPVYQSTHKEDLFHKYAMKKGDILVLDE